MSYPTGHEPSVNDGVEGLLVQIVDAVTVGDDSDAGDATAANQATQITAEQAILAKLNQEYTPTPVAVGASATSSIPATATSWSFLLLTGTGTIGGVAAPLGVPLSGGPLAAALAYTTAGSSSAFILYEVPA